MPTINCQIWIGLIMNGKGSELLFSKPKKLCSVAKIGYVGDARLSMVLVTDICHFILSDMMLSLLLII